MARQSREHETMRKRILELMREHEGIIDSGVLAKLLGISEADASYEMRVLAKDGYIEIFADTFDGVSGILTPSGEQLVREGVSAPTGGVNINVGALIQSMQGGNVQAVGSAVNSEITQVVNDPEQLKTLIDEIADQLIEAVRNELPRKELTAYTEAVEDLTVELQKPQRDSSKIKHLLSTLAFLADVEGAAGLMTRVWTILPPLVAVADKLMNTVPPIVGPM